MFVERRIAAPPKLQCASSSETTGKAHILKSASQQRMCNLLDQLAGLFLRTHEMFTDLTAEANCTHERLKSLRERVRAASEKVCYVRGVDNQ